MLVSRTTLRGSAPGARLMNHSHYVAFLDAGLLRLACAVSHETCILRSELCPAHWVLLRLFDKPYYGVQRIVSITRCTFGNDSDRTPRYSERDFIPATESRLPSDPLGYHYRHVCEGLGHLVTSSGIPAAFSVWLLGNPVKLASPFTQFSRFNSAGPATDEWPGAAASLPRDPAPGASTSNIS